MHLEPNQLKCEIIVRPKKKIENDKREDMGFMDMGFMDMGCNRVIEITSMGAKCLLQEVICVNFEEFYNLLRLF